MLLLSLDKDVWSLAKGQWWVAGQPAAQVSEPSKVAGLDKVFKKEERKTQNEILDIARKQHMNTDIKKSIFQAIVSAEDYL